jgi:hypothetical protein
MPYAADISVQTELYNLLSRIGVTTKLISEDNPHNILIPNFPDYVKRIIKRYARVVIADISYGNPNMLYDVGYAEGRQKHILLVRRMNSTPVPTNMSNLACIDFDAANINAFRTAVQNWIAAIP